MFFHRFKKFVIIPVLILVLLGPILAPFAESFNFPDRYDLVAILVEQGLYADTADYDGLLAPADQNNVGEVPFGAPIERTNLKARIDRYATDLQNALPGARALIIQVDRFEQPVNIMGVLERLYYEGDPKEPNRTAYLRGVVVAGEVPLPVVNKKGNRFISLFPYTDFEDRAYAWNPATQDFEIRDDNPNPQPEIWHGVIRPPASTQTVEGKEMLAAYFDKNHLYHLGDPAYATFNRRVFFQDFFEEQKNLNAIAYKNYLKFLEHQGDIAYMRYARELYKDLVGPIEDEIAQDEAAGQELTNQLAALGIPSDSNVPQPSIPADAPAEVRNAANNRQGAVDKDAIPDIMTKVGKMSDPLMGRFNDLFPKYPALINDFIKYTGRYLTPVGDDYRLEVDSAVNLITAKDAYTQGYLKAVNAMLEDKIDEIVNTLQQPVPLVEAKIKVTAVTRRSTGAVIPEGLPDTLNEEFSFVNFTPAFTNDGNFFLDRFNGLPKEAVTSVARCTAYRGSNGAGQYSKLVEINRGFNEQSGSDFHEDAELITGRTAAEKERGYQCHFQGATETCEGYEHFAGCFYDNKAHLFDDPPVELPQPQVCFPEHATDPVLEQWFYPLDPDPAFLGAGGTKEVEGNPPANFDNYKACFDFHEKEQFIEYLKSVDNRLEELSNDENYDNDRDERIRDMAIHPLEAIGRSPNEIVLFTFSGVNPFTVTLADVLRGLGWDPAADSLGWKLVFGKLIVQSISVNPQTVSLPLHPQISSARVQITRENQTMVSSVMYHKEPTNETLFAQTQNFITKDLPVDSPRYVTFQNFQHEASKITYPDLFSEPSFDEYLEKVRGVQDVLNNPALREAGTPAPCNNCLINLITNQPEIIAYPPKKDAVISRANFLKVMDSLNWKNMDIDSKHQYMSEYFLDPRSTKQAYVGESPNGYEIAYFNGEGTADHYDFALNKDVPEEDEETKGVGNAGAEEKDEPYEDDPKNPFDFPPPGGGEEGGYDLFSWSPPPISPWWERMKEWQAEMSQTVSDFEVGLGEEEFYSKQEEENKKELEAIKKESSDVEANLLGADKLDFSKITALALETDSNTLVANKKAQVKILLKDKDGALVNDEFVKVTLLLEGDGRLSEDNEITMMAGAKTIGVVANENPASLKLTAQIVDTERKAELNLSVVAEARLLLESPVLAVIADGENNLSVQVSARDANNQILTGTNGVVKVGVSDELMGQVLQKDVRLSGGVGNFVFKAGKKAGKILLNAASGALDPGTLELRLLPGPPAKIGLTADSEVLPTVAGSQVQISAILFDAYGNAVDTNSAQVISFRISQKTEAFGVLSSAEEIVENGVASVVLSPRELTGPVNIIAESPGLTTASITIKAVKQFGKAQVSQMRPESLTASLLGIPGGNVAEPDYLGGWFTMNGKVQAANSLTAQPKQYKKLFEISDRGGLTMPDPGRIGTQFLPVNNFTMVLQDKQFQLDLARVTLVALKEGQFEALPPSGSEEADPEKLADGIYIRKIADDEAYKVDRVKGALRLVKGDAERVEVQTNGFTRIFDNDFILKPREGKYLIIQILDKDTPVAEIFFVQRFDQDVKIGGDNFEAPGVYIKPLRLPPQFIFESTFLGNSTAQPRGAAFYDKSEEVGGPSAPGFAFQSLEDSTKNFGVGFTQGNKFALLFSSGETFGEANRPYASDIGIVLGDPTVRIDNSKPGTFSSDVGKFVYAGASTVRGLVTLDYNNDGNDDMLILEGENKIRLIQNNGGYDQLKDQGYLFDVKNGIQDLTKLDYNNDGQMDLVIAGKVSCRKGDTCIDVYENRGGAFARHNLHFDQKELVTTVRAEDINLDNFTDLIIGDTAGDVKILYNRSGVFDTSAQVVGNVGLQVDPAKNLIESVLIRYPGMTTKNSEDPDSVRKYQSLSVKVPNPSAAQAGFGGVFGGAGAPQVTVEEGEKFEAQDFMYADFDTSALGNSTKFGEDLNGGVIKSGDKIRYTITVKNDSGAPKRDVAVSDIIGEQLVVDPASIRCTDCEAGEMQIAPLFGHPTRPSLFKNIDVPARSTRHIVYEATFKGDTDSTPKITFAFNNRFNDEDNARLNEALRQDDYFDIAVSKEDNPTGRVRYYYTNGADSDGSLLWESELSSEPRPVTPESLAQNLGVPIPKAEDFMNIEETCILGNHPAPRFLWQGNPDLCRAIGGKMKPKSAPRSATDKLAGMQNNDSDGDGVQDSIDDINGTLDGVAEATSAAVSKLTCNAGCIPTPLNVAFLSPGFFSILGVPDGYDIGLPVFGWGAPSLIPTWPPMPPMSTLGGRFYVSPAITGGVGFALCLGPFGTPRNCFSFGINVLDLLPGNICDKIQGGMSGALAAANSTISKANEGMTITVGGGGPALGTGNREASGSGIGNYSLGSYEAPTAQSRNIRIPGFPSVITDWAARQWEEIQDKIFSLPDIYLIYPALDSISGSVVPTEKFSRTGNVMTNVLSWINSIPLIDIETQEVLFKVPLITRKEIEKFKADARQWVKDERLELDKWRNLMGCVGVTQVVDAVAGTELATPGNFANLELCRFVTAEMNKFINGVVANMEALDEWIMFPRKVLQFRSIEAYYLGQIIDYLDTIIQFTAGWMKKNTARLKQWRRAIRDIKQTVEQYKLFVKLMVDYNESCDKCKTERYSLKDLILKLFIAIPAPPVIPLPKLPDIVLDVSKIQAGLRIQWPDVKFKPVPFTLPRIPRIALGVNLTIPQFKLMAPQIPVIPKPPPLPQLPALPPLQLPKLPDLPPPPTMPGLPPSIEALISILKKIVKILCIIRLGFMPTDEFLLKTRIEEITARGLSPILPIDLLFTIQSPTISVEYVDQLRVTGFTNFQLDFSAIQQKVAEAAEKANAFSTDITKGVNKYTDALSKQLEKVTSPTINIGVPAGPEGRQLNYRGQGPLTQKELTAELSKLLGIDATEMVDYGLKINAIFRSLSQTSKEYEKIISSAPDKITLKVENLAYNPALSKDNFTDADLSLPFLKRLKAYRDGLVVYVNDTQRILERENLTEDLSDFSRFIASQRSPFIDTGLKKYLAANDFETEFSPPSKDPVKIGPLDLESADWLDEDDIENRLLAFSLLSPPQLPGLPAGGGIAGAPPPASQNRGIFFIDTNDESKRLVNYTLEADDPSQLADIDIDNDDDFEKLYSYGNNVYLKRNDRNEEEDERSTFRPEDIEFWTIFELKPHGFSPNFPTVASETARESSFAFEKSTTAETVADIAGYEFIAKNSPFYFENPNSTPTIRAHLLPEQKPVVQAPGEQTFTLKESDGEILVNDAVPQTLTAAPGDSIQTKENSSVILEAYDGIVVRVAEESIFKIPKGGPFELTKGEVEIEIPASGSLFFPPQTNFTAEDGEIRIRLFDGSDVRIKAGDSFALPAVQPVQAVLKGVYGGAMFTGLKRDYVSSSDGAVRVKAGEIIHPLDVVRLEWDSGGGSERVLTLSKDIMIPVPDAFSNGMEIEIDEGVLEIIRSEKTVQPVAAGMALQFGDEISVNTGSLEVHYARGGDTVIRANEKYSLNILSDFENPTATLALDPAFYFGKIYAFDSDGHRSNGSQKVLLAPQICGDDSPPIANFGKAQFQVAVGKTLPLDASRSFDSASRVISYFLDTDAAVDTDGDGIPNNDRDVFTDADAAVDSDEDSDAGGDGDSPQFTIGPYPEVGQKQMRLTVRDEGLNEGYQDITVDIITPRIVLDAPPLKSNIISGFVEPAEENVPITIARLRPGTSSQGWEIFKTPTADDGGQYYTNADGRFQIKDADLRDRLVIRDSTGNIIAEVNPKTGRITINDDRYEMRVIPSEPPLLPTRVGVFLKTDPSLENPVTFVYFVPDVNIDAVIDDVTAEYTEQTLAKVSGVHVKPFARAYELGFTFEVLPGSDPQIPGAVVAMKDGKRAAAFDVNGDIFATDGGLSFRVKAADAMKPDEPVVFEMLYQNEVIAEIFIAAHLGTVGKVQTVDAPTPPARPIPVAAVSRGKKEFTDVRRDDPLKGTLDKLSQRGIVAGYPSNVKGELLFKPENLINRAEFTLITEKMLCILPREEAKKLPTPFYDVLDPKLWFYPILKEGNIRGFIRGYLGDAKTDPATGAVQTPFRPDRDINRAEAVTVVLAALQEEDIIDMSSVDLNLKPGKQWFDPYIEIAQDLKPYLKNPADTQRTFLITPEEASRPNEKITRRDFAIMAERVLLMYDCNNPDQDSDGLPDTWELAQNKRLDEIQPDDDPDKDRCTNAREYEIGSDPFNADTDEGGVPDCTEIERGTDPVRNPYDDRPLIPRDLNRNEEGIFVIQPSCGNACPCRATMGPGSDLMPGDIIFAAITGHGGLPIYAKSNEETY